MNGTFEINDFPNTLIISICYAIIEVFGLCGNILVILTVYSGRRRFQSNNYRLVFHLAICDILFLLTGNLMFTVEPWMENQYWSNNMRTVLCVIIFQHFSRNSLLVQGYVPTNGKITYIFYIWLDCKYCYYSSLYDVSYCAVSKDVLLTDS